MADKKMSESALAKLLGKRTPRPGEGEKPGPNWESKAASPPPPAASPKENFLNPRAVNARREKEAGLAGGGKVRGCGSARKGHGKGKMY